MTEHSGRMRARVEEYPNALCPYEAESYGLRLVLCLVAELLDERRDGGSVTKTIRILVDCNSILQAVANSNNKSVAVGVIR